MNTVTDNYKISPKQATALRRLAAHDWNFQEAQSVLQTTLGALYKRGYIAVVRGRIRISAEGKKALHAQSNATIERAAGTTNSPFARVIRELANYSPQEHKVVTIHRAKVA